MPVGQRTPGGLNDLERARDPRFDGLRMEAVQRHEARDQRIIGKPIEQGSGGRFVLGIGAGYFERAAVRRFDVVR